MTRPNILWICTDQQRHDTIHCLNNPHISTPHLDALVAEGVAFTRAYCQNPVCTPSRASFLTGRYPRTTRARQNGQKIPDDEVLVSRMLADSGYDCGLSGKLHLAPCIGGRVEERIDDGYREFHWSHHPMPDWPENEYIQWLEAKGQRWEDHYHRPPGAPVYAGMPAELHQTTWCAEKAVEFMREPREGPWLMSVNFFDPHHPFDPPAEYLNRYYADAVPDPKFLPGELDDKPFYQQVDHHAASGGTNPLFSCAELSPRQLREIVAAYYAMIELIDDQVGRMLQALEDTGQRENTIVIFMSDHGEMLGDHGILLKGPHMYEGAVRVPLILSWDGHFKSGLRSNALVELVDLVPTLLEAVGLTIPARVQGRSLLPICTGDAYSNRHRDFVFCEHYNSFSFHTPPAYNTMLFDGRFKVVVYHGMEPGELYDLQSDPDEFHNLWDSPDHAAIRFDLVKQCFDASVFTLDPLPERQGMW